MFRFFRISYRSQTLVFATARSVLEYIQAHHSFSKSKTGIFTCTRANRYFHIYTRLNMSSEASGTNLIMNTRVTPMKWYLVPLMPFVKTYMHRKQIGDLQYLKDQMENSV